MEIILLLIGISLLLAIFFLTVFIVSIKSGQFKDTYSPSVRILFDDIEHEKGEEEDEEPDQVGSVISGKRTSELP